LVAAATAPSLNGLVINVGSGVEISVRELARLVQEVTGKETDVLYNAQTTGGVSRMRADLSLAGQKLNYHPSTSLEDGLRLTLNKDPRFT